MPAAPKQSWVQSVRAAGGQSLVPIFVVGLVFVMLVPLPSFALDLLLSMSITAGVLVLLTALQLLKPVEFSVFPSLILLLTLFRLSLDLASSRRILLHGSDGVGAAGQVIEAFGKFVVGGNYVVGFVLFLALIAIQFLVISHGAVRTAEVTARFTLDAMPGKQMAIDADMNAGLINEAQARARRAAIAHEAEFYGAMDGAARFSQRDSMATILITAINIVAGFLIGVLQQGMPLVEALKTYTVLTVGHGLVTMIPSLLVSVAGGIVLTRASSKDTLERDLSNQLLSSPKPIWITAGVLLSLAMIPGLPKLAFLLISGGLVLVARQIKPAPPKVDEVAAADGKKAAEGQKPAGDNLDAVIKLDELMLEVGLGLIPMVDAKQGGQLLGKIRSMRKSLAQQLGFLVPSIHITDNVALKEQEYVVYLRGVEIARWELRRDSLLAICSEATPPPLPGMDTKDPAFNVNAKWITPDLQAQALSSGYAVVDKTSVLATHLSELIKQNAHEMLTRQETKRLVDRINESHPKLVEELIPKFMTLGEVQKVLQQLLREQVSIRDLATILEVLVDTAPINKNPVLLVEAARQALSRGIVRALLDDKGALKVITLNAALEEECSRAAIQQLPIASSGNLQVSVARRVLEALKTNFGDQVINTPPILMCSSPGRFYLRRMLEPFLPKVVVISPTEVPPMIPVQAVGSVR
jgi:flagellar biosynthesis protein FlhA